jgi:hypothetical protein
MALIILRAVDLAAALLADLFERPISVPLKLGKNDLLSLGGALGGMLKYALGAGVMNELSPGNQALGHCDLAPGTEPFR